LKVKLPREYIKLSPISSAIIPHKSSEGQVIKTGYVKLSTFSQVSRRIGYEKKYLGLSLCIYPYKLFLFRIDYRQSAAEDMQNAIQEMKNQGVHSYILDLRNNPVTYSFDGKFHSFASSLD
jgi:C-terminal processing protease CtpA/Prc